MRLILHDKANHPEGRTARLAKTDMLTGMVAYMERQIRQGLSEDQVVERGIPARWKSWVDPLLTPEFVLSNLYEGASRHR